MARFFKGTACNGIEWRGKSRKQPHHYMGMIWETLASTPNYKYLEVATNLII